MSNLTKTGVFSCFLLWICRLSGGSSRYPRSLPFHVLLGRINVTRPNIPSFCFLREFGGEQLLSTWLLALWRAYACPAEPFICLYLLDRLLYKPCVTQGKYLVGVLPSIMRQGVFLIAEGLQFVVNELHLVPCLNHIFRRFLQCGIVFALL